MQIWDGEAVFVQKNLSELLKYLLAQNKPQTSLEIAEALSISVRSVKNHVKEINSLYDKKIILSSRNGYRINNQITSAFLMDDREDEIPQTFDERAFYIIKQLILGHNSRLDLFELCDSLCVSYSTIKGVISRMNKTFASYQVEFICENDCVRMKEKEKDKRKLISYILNEESGTSFMDTRQLKECFSGIDIDKLNQIVVSDFKKNDFYLNDFAAINMMLHLVILVERELNGNFLDSCPSNFAVENEREEKLLNTLCGDLEEGFQIRLNESERFEIYMLIKANASYTLSGTSENLKEIAGEEIVDLTHYYMEQISNLYLFDLSGESFFAPFCLHLKNMLFRVREGRPAANPLTESIKRNSPTIFDMAIFVGLDLMERYHVAIPEDEIAFLAIHIGAEIERQNVNNSKISAVLLCPDYQNLCIELSNKLMLSFGNQIKLIGTVHNVEELEELTERTKETLFKMLFTTIPVQEGFCKEYTVVKLMPFNLMAQYHIIQEALAKHELFYSNYKLRTCFHTFFEEDLTLINPECADWKEVIACLCRKLQEKNYTHKDFEEKVLKREYAATTAFGNIAIPHSAYMDAIKTSIALAISKKGILWGNNTVNLVLLLAINKADKKNFRLLYEALISQFGEDTMIQEVRNCNSFQEFESLIYQNIQQEDMGV